MGGQTAALGIPPLAPNMPVAVAIVTRSQPTGPVRSGPMPASWRRTWRAPLGGVAASGLLWALLLVVRGPATRPAAVVGAAAIAAIGTATVGLLARMVLGTAGSARQQWIAAMAGPIAAVALLG